MFADLDVSDDVATRPGLAGLCDVLHLPDSFAAVLVGVNHLSLDGQLAEQLMCQIRDTGARLLFVRPITDGTAGAMSPQCKQVPEWWQ